MVFLEQRLVMTLEKYFKSKIILLYYITEKFIQQALHNQFQWNMYSTSWALENRYDLSEEKLIMAAKEPKMCTLNGKPTKKKKTTKGPLLVQRKGTSVAVKKNKDKKGIRYMVLKKDIQKRVTLEKASGDIKTITTSK